MSCTTIDKLVSILKESPLYSTLSADERNSLVERITESYHFSDDEDDESEVGYESSWAGINCSLKETH